MIDATASESSQSMELKCVAYKRYSKRVQRVISKTGERNISFTKLPQKSRRYCGDFVTTIVSGM